MTRPPAAVDWFRILTQLDRAGINLPAVAKDLKLPYRTLHSIRNGFNDPRYETGRAIVDLWCFVFGKSSADVPRRPHECSAAKAKV